LIQIKAAVRGPGRVAFDGRDTLDQIYHVSFFKCLADSYGHSVDACQGAVEVRAQSEDRAIELARRKFAELKDVGIWSLRADYEKVELLASRKRISRRAHRDDHAEAMTALLAS
jgi:hypothetical protein